MRCPIENESPSLVAKSIPIRRSEPFICLGVTGDVNSHNVDLARAIPRFDQKIKGVRLPRSQQSKNRERVAENQNFRRPVFREEPSFAVMVHQVAKSGEIFATIEVEDSRVGKCSPSTTYRQVVLAGADGSVED